jgi:hypothetical protein
MNRRHSAWALVLLTLATTARSFAEEKSDASLFTQRPEG